MDLENMSEQELLQRKEELDKQLERDKTLHLLTTVPANQIFDHPPDALPQMTADDYEESEWRLKRTRSSANTEKEYEKKTPGKKSLR